MTGRARAYRRCMGVRLGRGVTVGDFSVLGRPYRRVHDALLPSRPRTVIGDGTQIGSHVIICKGADIGMRCDIDDFTKIEQDVDIGADCHIIYGALIGNEARIGHRCIIGGLIGERTLIGDDVRFLGTAAHAQHDPDAPWDDTVEPSPVIKDKAFVGLNALVIGGITIGEAAFVTAGAIVTRDVPARRIVFGVNSIIEAAEWTGRLRTARRFGL